MTAHEEQQIKALQAQGYGYKKIATVLGMPINTIKSYCRRQSQKEDPVEHEKGLCQNCGAAVNQSPSRKEKKFCSDKCRVAWWKKHHANHKTAAQQKIACSVCGKTFICYPSTKKKYCSRACYYTALREGCNK